MYKYIVISVHVLVLGLVACVSTYKYLVNLIEEDTIAEDVSLIPLI